MAALGNGYEAGGGRWHNQKVLGQRIEPCALRLLRFLFLNGLRRGNCPLYLPKESEARLKRVKRDYISGDLTVEEWRELRSELEPELEAAKAETQGLRGRLEEAEAGTALAEFQGEVLQALSEVRGPLPGRSQTRRVLRLPEPS